MRTSRISQFQNEQKKDDMFATLTGASAAIPIAILTGMELLSIYLL
jgi:hypothetical protein